MDTNSIIIEWKILYNLIKSIIINNKLYAK